MTTYRKALVVGAGPAGSTCAATLGRLRFPEVQIIDRRDFPRDKACAGGLSPRAIEMLRRLELLEQVEGRATNIKGAYLMTPSGHTPNVVIGKMALVMRRSKLDKLLLDEALSAGARLTSGVAVDRLLEKDGRVVGVGAGDLELEADVVVVATGARGRLLWDPRPRRRLDAIIQRFEGLEHEPDMMHVYYHRDLAPYYAWLFPEPEGTVNIGLFRPSGEGEESLVKLLERIGPEVFPGLPRATPLGRAKGHPIVYSDSVAHLVRDGALRVGEAGWMTDAFTGEGIWHGLLSGEVAARAIAEGDVRSYEPRLREEMDPALKMGVRLARFASTRAWGWALKMSSFKPIGRITGRLMAGLGK